MAAESTKTSLVSRDQNLPQPSVQAAVAHFSTLIEPQSSERMQSDLVILLSLLQGLTENVMSGDVVWLSAHRAINLCVMAGMNEQEVTERLQKFMEVARSNRKKNPISKMF